MDFKQIKVGEVLSSTMYMEVVNKTSDSVEVKDSFGRKFTVKGQKLIEESMNSNTQFTQEKKVTRTEAANILTGAGDSVFTAVFDKQSGEERVLVGKLVDSENLMGRSNVDDLLTTDTNKRRQIDHRTLKSIILKGTKYTVKK